MSNEQSEEKTLPPSEKKLREARKKGQFAQSRDTVAALSMVVLTLYLVFAGDAILGHFATMFAVVGGAAAGQLGVGDWERATRDVWAAGSAIILPMLALSALSVVLGAVISNRGIVFAVQPITPDINRINPFEGFKKIFSLRNFVEFIKALVKSMVLLLALGLAGWAGLDLVMRSPNCTDWTCVGAVVARVGTPLVIAATVLMLLTALLDQKLQAWLFQRDMKMTHSEMKRELKEQFGDPQIRSARRQARKDEMSNAVGMAKTSTPESRIPTLIINGKSGMAVALRYVRGETPAPVVLSKALGSRAQQLVEASILAGVTVYSDHELAENLLKRGKIGAYVPEVAFRDVARAISQSGHNH